MIIKSSDDLAKHYEFLSTSYHEAAHTIYGLLHFVKVTQVLLFENKKFNRIDGSTLYMFPNINNVNDLGVLTRYLKHHICIRYAGVVAEKHLFKIISGSDKFPMFLKSGSSEDIRAAGTLIKDYNLIPPGSARSSYKKKLIKEVEQELKDNWEAVTVVSHVLFKKKKINFRDLKNVLTKKTENKEFWKKQFKKIDLLFSSEEGLDEKEFEKVLNS